MEDNSQVVKIAIFGQDYPIRANVGDEDYVRSIAKYVDEKMREIDETMRPSSSMKIAILTALNIADELISLKKEKSDDLAEHQKEVDRFTIELDKVLED